MANYTAYLCTTTPLMKTHVNLCGLLSLIPCILRQDYISSDTFSLVINFSRFFHQKTIQKILNSNHYAGPQMFFPTLIKSPISGR